MNNYEFSKKLSKSLTKHGMSGTPEYNAWCSMKTRCYNEKTDERHGGYWKSRGVEVCIRWKESFEEFYSDMGDRPGPGYSLDRTDPNGHYSCGKCRECISNRWPMNARWATYEEQNSNRRPTGPRLNIIGDRFGRLIVIKFSHMKPGRGSFWKCVCDCGAEKVLRASNLRSKNGTRSCGRCISRSPRKNLQLK